MRADSRIRRAFAAAALVALVAGIASGVGGVAPQQAKLNSSDAASNDRFGISVSLSGDTAVVGAPQKNLVQGAAYVFTRSGTTWAQQAKLTPADAASDDNFGIAVAIDGDTAVVGAYGKLNDRGAVYVFTRTGTTWTQQAKLAASDAVNGDSLGVSVALAGDTVVAGAYGVGNLVGAAYVFTRTGTVWSQQAKLAAADGLDGDVFGNSVAVSGDTSVVGAYGVGTQLGAAYVFRRTGTTWAPEAKLMASDATANDAFGASVALAGDTAVAGATGSNSYRGAAYVFARTGTTWTQAAKLRPADAITGDQFGSVAFAGDAVVAGAYAKNSSQGAAYAFRRTGTTWAQIAKLTAADAADGDRFGSTVAVAGDTAVAGSFWKSTFLGAAYVFTLPPGTGLTSGYVLPAKMKAKVNAAQLSKSTLTVSGTLDTGSGVPDLSGAATFDVGRFHLDVPAFVPKGKSITYVGANGIALTIKPAKSGSSHATFGVKVTGDLSGDADGPLAFRFANAAHDAGGAATLAANVLAPHGVSAPILSVVSAKATIKGGGRDALKLTVAFVGDGDVPAAAEDLSVTFGGTFGAEMLAGSFVKKGNAWVRTSKAPGVTKAIVDYAKGTITIVGVGFDLGPFVAGGNPVVVKVTRGGDTRSVAVRMALTKTTLAY